jgi:hypothetical protein
MFKFRNILIAYAVAIPLALALGYLVATPDVASIALVGLVLFVLFLPLLIQWDHWLLIAFWNSAFIAAFLPGSVQVWMIFALLTFGMGALHYVMGHRKFLRAPELTKPILFLTVVVVLTAKIRGGLGLKVFGSSSYGGRDYFYLLGGIIGYFALTSQQIPLAKSARAVKWFLLSGLSNGLSNLLYGLGPAFYFLYYIVSAGSAANQAAADFGGNTVKRFSGLGPCGTYLLCYILARWGLRGLLDWSKPWRLLLVLAVIAAALLSGFRSQIGFVGALLVVQLFVEGLWKTPLLPVLCLAGILCLTPVVLFINKMPFAVQRSLAADFLPLNIDPNVRAEAEASTEWRLEMWRTVLPEVPKYLLVGKGYAIDPVDLYLTEVGTQAGLLGSYEVAMLAGDYHSGPLSVLMPFGIFGALAFVWLLAAGIKALHSNYRYGDARLRRINALLLSYFVAQCLFFFFVFGALNSQLYMFLGILGFSVSLNGGVCRKTSAARPKSRSPSLAAPLAVA